MTNNLELDFVAADENDSEGHRDAIARVYLNLVCGYLKGDGQPTMTADCTSFEDLEREVVRLRRECDAILSQGAARFGVSAQPGEPAALGGVKTSAAEAVTPVSGKTPLRMEQGLHVSDRMTRDVKTLGQNDKLAVADELMKAGSFRHVVVVSDEGDEIVGVVSQRDIFHGALAWSLGQGAAAHQKSLEALPVKSVMQSEVTTVTSDTPLGDAARTLLEGHIGCLPVVDDRRLVGILTEGDFLAMLTETERP
jgi:CBS domain-containing membrane protein